MTPIVPDALDLGVGAALIVAEAVLSLLLGLGIHRQMLVAAVRMVVQLLLVGVALRFIFALGSPWLTLLAVVVMASVAAREVAARPSARLRRFGNYGISAITVMAVTTLISALALTTAIRPDPWWTPQYAIPLTGIVLGSVLSASSLALDSVLQAVVQQRAAIEARLTLGEPFRVASQPLLRDAIRRGTLPIVNQMSAAGLVTLPGIMTGQILAGLDPVAAVKYQILLMFLLAGSSVAAAAGIAALAVSRLTDGRDRLRLDWLER